MSRGEGRCPLGLLLACIALPSCSDHTDPGGNGSVGLRVVAFPALTDTITATPVQGLVVEVRDENGRLTSGNVVRFAALPVPELPHFISMLVGSVAGNFFDAQTADTSDGQGRAIARVRFGAIAGPGAIEISVPEFGLADTVDFTITPGRPNSVRALPEDTAVFAETAVQLTAAVLDRFQNPRSDPVTFTLTSTPASAGSVSQSGRITTTTTGRIRVVAASGQARDTAYVSVVPRGTIAAVDFSVIRLVTIALDGSERAEIGTFVNDVEPEWSPDGGEVVVSPSGEYQEVHRVRPGGTTIIVDLSGLPGLDNPYWPSYSPDGQFLYFTNGPNGAIWRVRIDGSNAEAMTTASVATEYRPTISPDGRYVAFHTVTDGFLRVVVRISDLQTHSLTGVELEGRFPQWSPVSDSVAFLENDTGRLRLMHRNGSGLRFLTAPGDGRFFDGQMAWSPDGRWLVATGEHGLEVIEVATGLRLPLPFSADLRHPAWRPGS